ALSSCKELPATIAPTAAPPIIIISCGTACITGPSAPPVSAKPPKTMTIRITIPMIAYISWYPFLLSICVSADHVEQRHAGELNETCLARFQHRHDLLQFGDCGGGIDAAHLGLLVGAHFFL